MEGQFHAHYASFAAMQGNSEGIPGLDPNWPGQAPSFASEVEQLLGDDAEPDPLFFVESWTLGVPSAVENLQRRRNADSARHGDRERQSRAFRELDNLGSLFFVQQHEWYAQQFPAAPAAAVAEPRDTLWPQQYSEELASPMEYRASQDFADERDSGWRATDQMTRRRACQILGVTATSPLELIKAAYRRMVSKWHPDRLEFGSEDARRVATEKMASINEAYRLLRSGPMQESA